MTPQDFISALTIYNKEKQRLTYFDLNKAQSELLELLLEGHKRIIVVKARQLGISTLVRAYQFWLWYLAQEPIKLGVVAHTREAADNLHNTDKTFYNNLPIKIKPLIDKATHRTMRKKNGAELKSFTAGGQGGTRSYVFTHAHLSEFPFYENPEEALATIFAAVGDGQIVIESSPNIAGDYFNKLVEEGLAGKNEWKVLFFPWTCNDEYTDKGVERLQRVYDEEKELIKGGLTIPQISWRRKQISTLGYDKFIREYPRTIEEAFKGSRTTPYFWNDKCEEIKEIKLGSREKRKYKHQIIDGDNYTIGVDTSAGVGGDYSAFTIIHNDTLQPVYHYLSNTITPRAFAEILYETALDYGTPTIIVEANSYGASVLEGLIGWGWKKLWKDKDGRWFNTTSGNRNKLFSHFKEIIEDETIVGMDTDLLSQIKTCVWMNDRPDHPKGSHDDLLFSTMLCYWALKGKEVWREERVNPIDEWKKKAAMKRFSGIPLGMKPVGYSYNKKRHY